MVWNIILVLCKELQDLRLFIARLLLFPKLIFTRIVYGLKVRKVIAQLRFSPVFPRGEDAKGLKILVDSRIGGGIGKNTRLLSRAFGAVTAEDLLASSVKKNETRALIPIGEGQSFAFSRECLLLLNLKELVVLLHDTKSFIYWSKLLISRKEKEKFAQIKILVHTSFAEEELKENGISNPIRVIKMGVPVINSKTKKVAAAQKTMTIGAGGFWNLSRDVLKTIEIFKLLSERNPNWRFCWVGDLPLVLKWILWKSWQESSIHRDKLIFYPTKDDEEFSTIIESLAAFIHLRKSTSGESSGLAIECASLGVPVCLTETGPTRELPNSLFATFALASTSRDYAEYLERLLVDLSKYRSLQHNLRQWADSRTFEKYVAEIASLTDSDGNQVD